MTVVETAAGAVVEAVARWMEDTVGRMEAEATAVAARVEAWEPWRVGAEAEMVATAATAEGVAPTAEAEATAVAAQAAAWAAARAAASRAEARETWGTRTTCAWARGRSTRSPRSSCGSRCTPREWSRRRLK